MLPGELTFLSLLEIERCPISVVILDIEDDSMLVPILSFADWEMFVSVLDIESSGCSA